MAVLNTLTNLSDRLNHSASKILSTLLVLFCLAGYLTLIHYLNINFDQGLQIGAANALIQGEGLTHEKINLPEMDYGTTIERENLTDWPPGYSILILPLLGLINDIFLSSLLVCCVMMTVILWSWRAILGLLLPQIGGVLAVWSFFTLGLFLAPSRMLTPSGMVSLTGISVGIYLLLRADSHRSGWLCFLSGLFFGLATAFRFAYWPLLPVPAICLGLWAFLHKDSWKNTILSGVGALIPFLITYSYLKWGVGQTTFLENQTVSTGLNLGILLKVKPVFALPFGGGGGGFYFLESILKIPVTLLIWPLNFFVFLLCLYSAVSIGRKYKNQESLLFKYNLLGVLCASITLAMLLYLSLRYDLEDIYFRNLRYYVPLYVFIPCWCFFAGFSIRSTKIRTFVLSVLFLSLLGSCVWRGWYLVRPAVKGSLFRNVYAERYELSELLMAISKVSDKPLKLLVDDFGICGYSVAANVGCILIDTDQHKAVIGLADSVALLAVREASSENPAWKAVGVGEELHRSKSLILFRVKTPFGGKISRFPISPHR